LALAYASHFLMDAIPHFEDVGPLVRSPGRISIFLALGFVGAGLAFPLWRLRREAGLLWLVLSVWIGLGNNAYPQLRMATALAAMCLILWKQKSWTAVGCLLAGMLAAMPDLIPFPFEHSFHDGMHYKVGWGTRLYVTLAQSPLPLPWLGRLRNPYYLMGYGAELIVEGALFWGSLYLFTAPAPKPAHSPVDGRFRQ